MTKRPLMPPEANVTPTSLQDFQSVCQNLFELGMSQPPKHGRIVSSQDKSISNHVILNHACFTFSLFNSIFKLEVLGRIPSKMSSSLKFSPRANEHKDLRLPRINFSPIIPAIIPGPRKQPSREVGIKVGKHVLPLVWIWK